METKTMLQAVVFLQCIPAKQAVKLQMLYWDACEKCIKQGLLPLSPDAWLNERMRTRALKFKVKQTTQSPRIKLVQTKFRSLVMEGK